MSKENFFVKQEEEIATETQPIDPEKTEDDLEIKEEEERKRNLQNVAAYHFGLLKDVPTKKQEEVAEQTNFEEDKKQKEAKELREKIRMGSSTNETVPEEKTIQKEKSQKNNEKDITTVEKTVAKNEDGRFIFYTDRRKTGQNILPSDQNISDYKNKVFSYKEMLTKEEFVEDGRVESPDFIKEVEKTEKQLLSFTKNLGIDIANRLPKNENVYELDDDIFEIIAGPNKRTRGKCLANEVFVRKSLNEVDKPSTLRHELIHSISKVRILLRKTNMDKLDHIGISVGYDLNNQKPEPENDGSYLKNFNEGLTELTNLQIALEYEGECTDAILYIANVIFVSELAKDIAARINHNPEKVKNTKFHPSLDKQLTPKDILTHLQIGMFENDPRYLKIISDLYDDDSNNFNALKALSKMGNDKDVLEAAEAFRLTEAIAKLNDYIDKKAVELDVADFGIPLNN